MIFNAIPKPTLLNIIFTFWFVIPNFLLAAEFNGSSDINRDWFLNSSAETILNQMSLDEKVGQLLLIGFPQDRLDAKLNSHLLNTYPGSFLIFKRNILNFSQIQKLNSDLINFSFSKQKIPPLLSIDQEGGFVSRLNITPKFPFLFLFNSMPDFKFSLKYGEYTGELLSELGFNLNLAPVLDVADLGSKSFMALRSFGSNPANVSKNGYNYSYGLLSKNVIPTAKHFPGLGSIKDDPHNSIIINSSSSSELFKKDLIPFYEFSKLGPNSAVMMSHMIYKSFDPSGEPASFSSFLMNDTLRKKLNFSGLILTDDLHMKASSVQIGPAEAALKAIKAGADIAMLSWSFSEQTKAFSLIKKAVKSGELSNSHLNSKVLRILKLKKFIFSNLAREKNIRTLASLDSQSDIKLKPPLPNNIEKHSRNVYGLIRSVINSRVQDMFFKSHSLSNAKLCILSSNSELISYFDQKAKSLMSIFNFSTHNSSESILNSIEKNNCGLILVTVENLKNYSIISSFSKKTAAKTILINSLLPSLIGNRNDYFSILDLYGLSVDPFDIIAKKITDYLNSQLTNKNQASNR